MRVRKNADLSYLKAVPRIQCQLNQNPWDVMGHAPPPSPLPPPLFLQVNKTGASGINDSSMDHTEPMEQEKFSDDGKNWEHHVGGNGVDKMEQPDDKPVIRCRRNDGRKWNCKNEAVHGNTLCEYHLSKARKYNNSSRLATKKKDKAADDTRRSSFPSHNKELISSSIPNDFYYYSCDGPPRSKKRRGVTCGDKVDKNLENEQEVEPSKSSQGIENDFDYVYED